jgi:hypothetical protein
MRKVKALLLALLTLTGLSIFAMPIISLGYTLFSENNYSFTLVNFKEAFFAVGAGIGIGTVYKDMLDYLRG